MHHTLSHSGRQIGSGTYPDPARTHRPAYKDTVNLHFWLPTTLSNLSVPSLLDRKPWSGERARMAERELPGDRRRLIRFLGFGPGTRLTSGFKDCCGARASSVSTYACFRLVTTIRSLARILLTIHVVVRSSLLLLTATGVTSDSEPMLKTITFAPLTTLPPLLIPRNSTTVYAARSAHVLIWVPP